MITLTDLCKVYRTRDGNVTALNGISLSVPDGVIHGIVGPSGAGKSTLIRCLTALERPDRGSIVIDGQELVGLRPNELRQQRRRIGMVFQDVNLLDARTALANVAYPLRIAGRSRREANGRARQLLELVDLGDRIKAYPAQLSGGQRQRVGIARALAAGPSVLLCDEPSSALDWETTRHILELIRRVRDRFGITVLIITHEMAVVRQVCDSVTLLNHGQIVQSGRVADVIADHGSRLARALIPLPETSLDSERAQLEVSVSSQDMSVDKLFHLLAYIDMHIHVQAGTIETVDGERVGRFQIEVASYRRDDIAGRLRAAGVFVEKIDGTQKSDVPWDAEDEQEDAR